MGTYKIQKHPFYYLCIMFKIMLTLVFACMLQSSTMTDTQVFTVHISNVSQGKGQVMVALFSNEKVFLGTATYADKKSSAGNELTFKFRIPEGAYAISVFQDMNNNGKLDKNWTGIPSEPIGFGNNYKPFGPPSFEKSKVTYTAEKNTTSIKLYTIF